MFESKISPDGASRASRTRRAAERDSLFLSATIARLRAPEPELLPVRVRNLSADGMMADFTNVAEVGEPVVVTVRGIGAVSGHVAWIRRGRIGIRFDVEVDPLMARRPVGRQAQPPIR